MKITDTERSLTLADLISSGRLKPGPLTASYLKKRYTAELRQDGSIQFNGATYTSASGAAVAVKHLARGTSPQQVKITDRGWGFWHARDHVDQDDVTLLKIRHRHACQLDASKK
ncbi:hypothetical protein ACFQVC_21620 [Streptomyces monticola]|uniref:RAMA domain-containing protein n=1 Tax=Streptomyces monticola TaxID=2666263 RepID=A0ABW2JN32_9ACTN